METGQKMGLISLINTHKLLNATNEYRTRLHQAKIQVG